ncbi:MAG: hypothetical protein LBI42_03275 [Chitinispirillales bacterium]|jgi:hypothetical protein|nr:hypothetical protein [Chitinispirillales bacterium]
MVEKDSFAKKYSVMIFACVLALALAGFMAYNVDNQKKSFDKVVSDALKTSEGYDQAFIDMVNRLEDELAERASFGYAGRKDPMTGTVRQVAAAPVRRTPPNRIRSAKDEPGAAKEVKQAAVIDPVRLTAIIFDNTRNTFTAVVMDGERSYSVDVGDRVAGRRITRIAAQEITMESDTERFTYHILGNNTRVHK